MRTEMSVVTAFENNEAIVFYRCPKTIRGVGPPEGYA